METATIELTELQEITETLKSIAAQLSKKEETVWLDNQEVCQLLKISKRTLQFYRDTKVISFSQIGHKIYYKKSAIEEMLEKHYIDNKQSK